MIVTWQVYLPKRSHKYTKNIFNKKRVFDFKCCLLLLNSNVRMFSNACINTFDETEDEIRVTLYLSGNNNSGIIIFLFRVWNVRYVQCLGWEMFRCGMFRMRNVWGGMFGMLGVGGVRWWKIGMFRIWDIRDSGCWGVGCLKCGM